MTNKLFRKLLERRESLKRLRKEVLELQQVEKAPRESENWLRELIEPLPIVIYEMDEKGEILFTNRSGFECFRYTQQDLEQGVSALDLIVPEDRDLAFRNVELLLRGERIGPNKYTALRKDGTTFPVLIYSKAILRDGKPKILRGFVIGITEENGSEYGKEKYTLVIQNGLSKVVTLSGPLPVCVSCRRICDDKGYWHQIEAFFQAYFDIESRNSICPECSKKLYPKFYQ